MSKRPLVLVSGKRQVFQPSSTIPFPICITSGGKQYCNHNVDSTLQVALVESGTGLRRRLPSTDCLDIAPDWKAAWNTPANWNAILNANNACKYTAPATTIAVNYYANGAAANAAYGTGVYVPAIGKIICLPINSTAGNTILVITPGTTPTCAIQTPTGTSVSTTSGWPPLFLGNLDNRVYSMSGNALLIIDTSTNPFTTSFYSAPYCSSYGYAYSPYDNAIYGTEDGSGLNLWRKITLGSTPVYSKPLAMATNNYASGHCAPNGKLYFLPGSGTASVRVYDPSTNTDASFGSLTGLGWNGCVLAPNGYIYGIPSTAITIAKINPTNNTVAQFGSVVAGTAKWQYGACTPDGYIFCAPYSGAPSAEILVINTNNDTTAYLANPLTVGLSIAGLGPDGAVYMTTRYGSTVPTRSIIRITTNLGDVPMNICANPFVRAGT